MTRFVDTLRNTPNKKLDPWLRMLKLFAMRGSVGSPEVDELEQDFADAKSPLLTDAEYQRMTNFLVKDDLADVVEAVPDELITASFKAFRPLCPLYSMEIAGSVTYFVFTHGSTTTAIVCGIRVTGEPVWLYRVRTDEIHFGAPTSGAWNTEASYREFGETRDAAAAYFRQMLCQTTIVLTVPGLYLKSDISHPPKLQTARRRRGKRPLAEIVVLDIDRPKLASDGVDSDGKKMDVIRHQVIGHFRLLTKDRAAPVLSFVRSHWRGNPDIGVKHKDYAVAASGLPFSPPSMTIEAGA